MNHSQHIVCPHCSATNRVPVDRLADWAKCGRCKHALFNAHPVELTDTTFMKHIGQSDIPVVVDFWASWCGPCRVMEPVFEQAARELEPAVRLAKLNTEEAQTIAAQFGIRSIPTIAIFKEGREFVRQAGAMDLGSLLSWVRSNI